MAISLALHSCKQNQIENGMENGAYLYGEELEIRDLRRKYPRARPKPDTLTKSYNCHGLTFAAGRTAITHSVEKILVDDGYKEIDFKRAWVGDVVAYYSPGPLGPEIAHSAFVIERVGLELWVLSKWGPADEYIHPIGECPWGTHHKKCFRKMR